MLGYEVRVSWSDGPSEVEATDSVHPYSSTDIFPPPCKRGNTRVGVDRSWPQQTTEIS